MRSEPVIVGQQWGRWTVLGRAPTRKSPSGAYFVYWHCRCACGALVPVRQQHLLSGRTLSCGCWKREAAIVQKTTHGGRHTLLYDVWTQMIQRCDNEKNKSYCRYGGRNISVCNAWRDFGTFQSWAANSGYAQGLTIDREDNDGDYEPGNCRWVPNVTNCRNNSITLKVEWQGDRVPLATLAERHGLKPNTAYSRYQLKGWTLRQALGLDTPPQLQRSPITEATRQRMRVAALVREQSKRKESPHGL